MAVVLFVSADSSAAVLSRRHLHIEKDQPCSHGDKQQIVTESTTLGVSVYTCIHVNTFLFLDCFNFRLVIVYQIVTVVTFGYDLALLISKRISYVLFMWINLLLFFCSSSSR